MHDLVIRGGLVVDGSGAPAFEADVAVDGGRIAGVGKNLDRGVEEVDARGRIVTPGFIDLHTHYDAQVMWDPVLAPSSWNGVTTIVMGNCAVGFAPTREASRPFLIQVMEAIEEIPEPVLNAGLEWDWETFPQYLDAVARRSHTVDIGAQVANVALRNYVLGDRADGEPATQAEIQLMAAILEESLRAGALGLSFTRSDAHTLHDGRVIPGADAPAEEALGMCDALARVGDRVIQYVGSPRRNLEADMELIETLAARSQSTIHVPLTTYRWRERLDRIAKADKQGLKVYAHVSPRGQGVIIHWASASCPFVGAPSLAAIAGLPWAQRLERLKRPEFKAKVLSELDTKTDPVFRRFPMERLFELEKYPDYEPDPAVDSIAARAGRAGQDPAAYVYDVMMRDEGRGMIFGINLNYDAGDLDDIREILSHPNALPSLSDGGAHCTRVVDAGQATFMLSHWARDRRRGEKLPLEMIVHRLTWAPASAYGLRDRGRVERGYLADLNVIDLDRVRLAAPYATFDLPAGGQRLLQKPEGYVATIKRGQVTFRDAVHCGRFPGQVVRGPQPAAART